jgi:hypothetical protein
MQVPAPRRTLHGMHPVPRLLASVASGGRIDCRPAGSVEPARSLLPGLGVATRGGQAPRKLIVRLRMRHGLCATRNASVTPQELDVPWNAIDFRHAE